MVIKHLLKFALVVLSIITVITGLLVIQTEDNERFGKEKLIISKLPLKFADEYSPACASLTEEGKLLAFQSPHSNGYGSSDIWLSNYVNGSWSKPHNAGRGINTSASEYDGKLSADGSKIVFIRSDENMKPSIFISHFKNGEWSDAEAVGPPISYPNEVEYGAVFSRSGNRLYFSSNREGSFKGFDVYYSDLTDDGWSDPVNMGSEINSKGDAIDVAIGRDEKTVILAFKNNNSGSSESNLYVSNKTDKGWSSFQDLGPRINTPGNEACPWLGYDGQILVLNSTWNGLMNGQERTDTRWGSVYVFQLSTGFKK